MLKSVITLIKIWHTVTSKQYTKFQSDSMKTVGGVTSKPSADRWMDRQTDRHWKVYYNTPLLSCSREWKVWKKVFKNLEHLLLLSWSHYTIHMQANLSLHCSIVLDLFSFSVIHLALAFIHSYAQIYYITCVPVHLLVNIYYLYQNCR